MKNKPLIIGNTTIQPGERVTLGLPTPELSTYISMHIPIHILHGKNAGPTLLISGALHGDEMNGIEIIHKLLNAGKLKSLSGTLIAVPAVNVYGLMTLSRNLPDRRDLDGSFPGIERGSFASRLAHYFNQEILSLATHCIDIHTGGPYQHALPQVHTNLDQMEAQELALAFQPYVVMHDSSKRGLLWQNERGIPTLIYEAGEPLRFDERSIRTGYRGILRVMEHLNMVKASTQIVFKPVVVRKHDWVYSPGSGLCRLFKKIGTSVKKGELIAEVHDPFGTAQKFDLYAPFTGIIVTQNTLPLVNEGDAIIKLAKTEAEVTEELWNEN